MIKLSKLADYGIVIMTHLARPERRQETAHEIAMATAIPQPTASKILKALARAHLVASQRGVKGGYEMARPAAAITVAEIIEALDGPIALTECLDETTGGCMIETCCPARTNWRRINDAIREALDGVTLAEMVEAIPVVFLRPEDRFRSIAGEFRQR